MIVRISGEGQFRLDDGLHDKLNELDNAVRRGGRGAATRTASTPPSRSCSQFVRSTASELGDDDLERVRRSSCRRADLTFAEAGEEFTGDGLIPEPS